MEQQKTEAEIEQEIEQLKKITRKDGTEKYAEAQFELGRIYYEYKKDWQKAKKHLLNIKKQDNPKDYAQAQLYLGITYQNKQDIKQAERCYLNVKKQDNPWAYAGAQLNLGLIYQEVEHNIEQAERCYLNVKKQDNPMNYAQAQLNLGIAYQYKKQDIKLAKHYYLNVEKQDNLKAYAQAQLNLGVIYQEVKHNIEKAEQYYINVKTKDNPRAYAWAQLNLGVIYHDVKHNIEKAEQYYINVKTKDNPKAYAQAQLYLGIIYQFEYNNSNRAEEYYSSIEKQDNPEAYAQAQFNLGITYQFKKQDIKQTKHYYLNVEKQDNPKEYANAELNLGVIYEEEKHNIEQAEHCYLNVEKQYNPKLYAAAQLNLAVIYQNKQDIERAERCFLNVNKQDNSEGYAYAQFYLGLIYQYKKQDIKQAERYYLNVEKQDNPDSYVNAQIKLGDNVFFNKTENKLKSAEEYYQNVTYPDDSFIYYIIAQMMLSVISNKDLSIFEEEQRNDLVIKICDIRELTLHIQKELLVEFNLNESENNDGLIFERQVAHYTKPEVLFNLLKNKPSDFRLNVVDFMNDPTENQVLTDWLGVKTEKENEIKTFLASFSFNHNSLNQFRLYGNENNIVGSSVSAVFNKKFFGDDINRSINPESINHLFNSSALGLPINDSAKSVVATMGINDLNESLNQKIYQTENDLNENSDLKNSETVTEKNITSSVGSLPLFRCLYFDPKNGYISIAKRNKYSFYLEHQSDSAENIDAKWNNYLDSLNEEAKINTVREKLQQIEEIIHSLKNPEEPKQKEIIEKITNLDQLIALALMPISCLIKHAAFEDEDECRMFYITNIADELIQAPKDYAYANSLFVNYGKIEDYLEKIYLGPQCKPHHKLWITNHVRTSQSKTRSKPIKVVQSEMPLR